MSKAYLQVIPKTAQTILKEYKIINIYSVLSELKTESSFIKINELLSQDIFKIVYHSGAPISSGRQTRRLQDIGNR